MKKNDIIRMAREAGFVVDPDDVRITDGYWIKELTHFAALVAAAEREACAKVCEDIPLPQCTTTLIHLPTIEACAAAIRARGNTGIEWEVEP